MYRPECCGTRGATRTPYRLTYNNNGDAWRFTSNFQVISVVEMLRHKVLPGQIFVMRKDELQTVLLKFDDMQSAAGRWRRAT